VCVRIAIGFLCRRVRSSARNMKKRKLAVFENQEIDLVLFVATQQCGIAQAGKVDKTGNW